MKSILDPTFRYVPSTATDLRKTFARVRRELKIASEPPSPRADIVPLWGERVRSVPSHR